MTIAESQIEINAPPAEVRAVVLGFDRIGEWHSGFIQTMRAPQGKTPEQMVPGDDLFLRFLQVAAITVKVVKNSERALAWEGGNTYLFHGHHTLSFEPLDDGKRTLFRNREVMQGFFPAVPGVKQSTVALHEGYNRDVKKRVEAGGAAIPRPADGASVAAKQ